MICVIILWALLKTKSNYNYKNKPLRRLSSLSRYLLNFLNELNGNLLKM